MICDALYLPSNIVAGPIAFEIELNWERKDTKEGFNELTRIFMGQIAELGKTLPFPPEIIQNLNKDDDKQIDRLLEDTEFILEMTYFLKLGSSNIYFSRQNAEEYRLRGANANRYMFETLDQRIIDVVKVEDVRKVYEEGKGREEEYF